jgi:hypothetical protein
MLVGRSNMRPFFALEKSVLRAGVCLSACNTLFLVPFNVLYAEKVKRRKQGVFYGYLAANTQF